MESSTIEEQRRREERQNNMYSPCYFCQKLISSILKCLGYDSDSSTTEDEEAAHLIPSHDEPERGMKINEERAAAVQSTRVVIKLANKPQPPPVSSGGGGKINYAPA
ncbi:hypothetical protein P3X46_012872 [Hevea brasiliensis]|uniref:Uncharacterized protein n=1 Tax=Hevea brasiliensis TaxID=3981 RepID=A0ABQ9MF68_HEVBR|nr:hypothetical protein P3X46_012872 [Hevea brasiliensis]